MSIKVKIELRETHKDHFEWHVDGRHVYTTDTHAERLMHERRLAGAFPHATWRMVDRFGQVWSPWCDFGGWSLMKACHE